METVTLKHMCEAEKSHKQAGRRMRGLALALCASFLIFSCKDDAPEPAAPDYRDAVTGVYVGVTHRSDTNTSTQVGGDTTYADTITVVKTSDPGQFTCSGGFSYCYILDQDYTFAKTGSPLSSGAHGFFSNLNTDTVRLTISSSTQISPISVYWNFTGIKQ
jgi:hypothetical protein